MKRTNIIMGIIFGMIAAGIIFGVVYKVIQNSGKNKISDVSNSEFQEVVNVTDKGFQYNNSEEDNKVTVRDESEVYNDMHRMVNTKIVADEIWGEDEINEERLNRVILEVMKSNYPDKERLLTMLYNWKNKNFKNCVEEHNYIWEKLGGNVGKARALRKQ